MTPGSFFLSQAPVVYLPQNCHLIIPVRLCAIAICSGGAVIAPLGPRLVSELGRA